MEFQSFEQFSHYSIPQIINKQEFIENKVTPARVWKWFYEREFFFFEFTAAGKFGEIKKGKFLTSGIYENEIVALKYPIVKKETYNWDKEYHHLSHEISCNLVLHPNIINYIGGLDLEDTIGVIMEFVSYNLRNFITNDSRISNIENKFKIAKQICSGMNFLHSLNPYILHRDLRTPNILINDNLECKISDFGISNNVVYKGLENKNLYTSLIPPECRESGAFTKKSDVYFFGWILFELFLEQKYQFEYDNNFIIKLLSGEESKVNELFPLKDKNGLYKGKELKFLIVTCLQSEPSKRPSFYKLLLAFNNLLKNEIDYSIISQMEESLSSIKNKYGIDISDLMNYTDSLGRKLVHEYCIYNNLKGLKELISIIGNEYLNLTDKYDCTCAHFAARNGNIQILKFLSANGFNKWNKKERRFDLTPLRLSLLMKHDECIQFLSNYSNIECLNEALISSSQEGNFEYLNFFLEKGANINSQPSGLSATPLFWASRNGYLEIVEFLITNGAFINQGTTNGHTPLFIASQKGQLEIIRFLMKNGAEINQGRNDIGCTPLYIACECTHFDVVKELIKYGAEVNQERTDDNCTPLFVAVQKGSLEIIKYLLDHGAEINKGRISDGSTPLLLASQNGDLHTVKFLISYGADVNQGRNDIGCSPLFVASQNGHLDIVKELINNGANVNQIRTDNGTTPLYVASQKGHLEIVKELVNNGANVNQIRTDNGYTPLFVAWRNNKQDVVSFLKEISDINLNIMLASQNYSEDFASLFVLTQ